MRSAIIGVGRMGRRHIRAAQSAGLEVAGVCDADPKSLAAAESEEGIGSDRHYTDVATMLAKTRPDCVIIATTAPSHAGLTCAAAEAGVKYVLCEKPMATTLDDCNRMIEACAKHGTRLAINHQMRFMEQYTVPKGIMDGEAFGGLCSATFVDGNFGLVMNGTHYFEAFRFLTGTAPRWVTAWLSPEKVPNPRGPQFEDRAGAVRLVNEARQRCYLECSADQGHGMQAIYAGPRGQIFVDELYGDMIVAVREEEHRALPTTRYGMPAVRTMETLNPADAVAPSAAVLRALIGENDYPSGEDGRLAVRVAVAAHLSHERGNATIDLGSDDLPSSREFPWA